MRPLQILVTSLVAASIVSRRSPAMSGMRRGLCFRATTGSRGRGRRSGDASVARRDTGEPNIAGLEVKRRILRDRVLTRRDIGARSAVKASTPVEVIWKAGGLVARTRWPRIEDGASATKCAFSIQ